MSTLKTHNIQSPDAGSVNILMTPNAGMVVTGISTFNNRINTGSLGVTTNFTVAGISTFSGQLNVGSNIKAGVAGVVTATAFHGSGANLTGLASREVYGFTGIGKSLSLTTTNNGADNITNAIYAAFEENFIGPSGISFSINTSGNLIMTV